MTQENLERRVSAIEDLLERLFHGTKPLSERISIQTKGELLFHAPTLHIETDRLDIEGETYAKLSYSLPLTWRSGQPRLKLIHKNRGFPIIISIKGSLMGIHSEARVFIDEVDHHWYLAGKETGDKQLEIQVICVGKVSSTI